MKEIYQQTVEEILERVNGKKSGLTSEPMSLTLGKFSFYAIFYFSTSNSNFNFTKNG